jgi:hypothetical protein
LKRPADYVRNRSKIETKVLTFFREQAGSLAEKVRKATTKPVVKTQLSKADGPTEDEVNSLLEIDWVSLNLSPELAQIAIQASTNALGLDDKGMIAAANDIAGDWAKDRAAELVGMQRIASGEWIVNPDAQWAISDTTREGLRRLVADAFAAEAPLSDLAEAIESSTLFDEARASMIAKTEASRSQEKGNLAGWRTRGNVTQVTVLLSFDHDPLSTCDCSGIAAGGPYPINDAPELPVHPNCECGYLAVFPESE